MLERRCLNMKERIEVMEGNVHLPPEFTQGREWLNSRYGVDEGRVEMHPVYRPPNPTVSSAKPEFTGGGGT